MVKLLFAILALAVVEITTAADWYVSPTGSSTNSGAIGSPWSLRFAGTNLSGVSGGDTIWMRGGTYPTGQTNTFPYTANVTLLGLTNNHITIRPYPNETVVIDPGLYHMTGDYVTFRDLRFTCSGDRINTYWGRPAALSITGHDKVINCLFYNTGHPALNGSGSEVYGNILWGTGIFEYDGVTTFPSNTWTRGSALYLQNSSADGTLVQNNISRGNLNAGMKAYAENGQIQQFTFDGNVSFLNNGEGIEVECLYNSISNAWVWNNNTYRCLKNPMGYFADRSGAGGLAHHGSLTYSNNYDYGSPGAGVAVVWMMRWSNITSLANTTIATSQTNEWLPGSGVGQGMAGKFINLEPITNVVTSYIINSNSYYGGREQAAPFYQSGGLFQGQYTPFYVVQAMGYDGTNGQMSWGYWTNTYPYDRQGSYTTNLPTANVVVLRTNKYEPGRSHLVVWNWESNSTATVNLSQAGLTDGQRFEVLDVQNYFGAPVLTTNYSAASPSVVIPLTATNVTAITGEGFAESFTFNPNIHTASLFNVFMLMPVVNSTVGTLNIGTLNLR